MEVRTSICRSCNAFCPVDVTIEDGRVRKVEGNRRAPLYLGYICPKGRSLPELHNLPDRLLTSLKKQPDGTFKPISSEDLIDELSEKIGGLLAQNGTRSIAAYLSGGVIEQPAAAAMMVSFLGAIGSPMFFSASTIDQPGIPIAYALHGRWGAGRIRPELRDVFMIVGGNPINSKQYLPQNPGMQIKAMRRKGAKIVVIDPRRTETARVADVHLQPIPGEDPTILAGLIHLIIAEGGVDRAFVDLNAQGLAVLTEAVRPFTPEYVAARAGVAEADLRLVAKIMIEARTGDVALGTGPSMATRGILSSYLAMCLNTLRGFWPAEGDEAMHPSVLVPPRDFKAQPIPPKPAWGFGEKSRYRGLEETSAGLPLAALPEEIMTPGEGQIKALFMHGGAVQSWPQQSKTIEALQALDLLVMHDVVMSPTAQMADYVIATKMQFEMAAFTQLDELISTGGHSGYGWADPFAYAGPAIVGPPPGSDLLEAWQTYYRIARKLGIQLPLANWKSTDKNPPLLDMENEPSTDELYDRMCAGSAVSIDEVRQYPDGKIFDRVRRKVIGRDADCEHRLELGNPDMMEELREVAAESPQARRGTNADYPFQLIPSRMQNSSNGFFRVPGVVKWTYNPAFMNPRDMVALDIIAGAEVKIRSRHGEVIAIAQPDEGLREGVVALMHGYGGSPGSNVLRRDGTNVNQLTSWDDDYEKHTGMPRMGALPIAVSALP